MHRHLVITILALGAGAVWMPARHAIADDQLLAGVASVDITPEPGLILWGYSNRTHGATGTLDPLMAKAVVLRADETAVAIVSLDLGRTPEDQLAGRGARARRWPSAASAICSSRPATRTMRRPWNRADSPNPYADKVRPRSPKIVCDAAEHLVPVRIGVGRGTADFAHNRRKFLPDGRVAMQWRNAEREPTEPVDREYAIVRLDRPDGTPLAVLFNYACHPVVMGGDNYQYSADYVGGGPQDGRGAAEDDVPVPARRLRQHQSLHGQDAARPGRRRGNAEDGRGRRAVARRDGARHQNRRAGQSVDQVRVPPDAHPPPLGRTQPGGPSVLSKAYGRRFDNYLAKTLKNNTVQATLTTLLIDDNLALVGMPGEIFVQFQTDLKARSPVRDTFLVGYTNGYHAYFPTIRDAAAGGYGGKTATYVEPGCRRAADRRRADHALQNAGQAARRAAGRGFPIDRMG